MESAEIVRRFLTFFEQHDHAIVPSASLVAEDPTLMFVVATRRAVVINSRILPFTTACSFITGTSSIGHNVSRSSRSVRARSSS